MAKYRVKPGMTYGAYGTFREGDIVELPEYDAQPFLDKLDLVVEVAPVASVPDAPPEVEPESVFDTMEIEPEDPEPEPEVATVDAETPASAKPSRPAKKPRA